MSMNSNIQIQINIWTIAKSIFAPGLGLKPRLPDRCHERTIICVHCKTLKLAGTLLWFAHCFSFCSFKAEIGPSLKCYIVLITSNKPWTGSKLANRLLLLLRLDNMRKSDGDHPADILLQMIRLFSYTQCIQVAEIKVANCWPWRAWRQQEFT